MAVALVLLLVASGGSTPFAHLHTDGRAHASHGAPDAPGAEHDRAQHHQDGQGRHWHLTAPSHPADDADVNTRHPRHPQSTAVAITTVAEERSTVDLDDAATLTAPGEAGPSNLDGGQGPLAGAQAPDPPPSSRPRARAPPLETSA
jgi:hypothetical protein